MRILLVGEYSRLHNSLKEGLEKIGHEVVLLGHHDGFKNYPVDLPIRRRYTSGLRKTFKNGLYYLFGYDLESQNIKAQIKNLKSKASQFDIVQFINEAPFGCTVQTEKQIFDLLSSWNDTSFLLSCGTDYTSVNFANENQFKYSILTPYYLHKDDAHSDSYGLKFLNPKFKNLHEHIFSTVKGVIASDMDYHLPLKGHPKYLGMVPNPVNTDKISYQPIDISGKIIIFHGINSMHYYKKGNDLFEDALIEIKSKYNDRVDIITMRDVPYQQYIEAYNSAHILLDQVYAYDQGYNALEAMAKGKVVFTGAEQEWLDYYNLEEDTVAINALPNVKAIIAKLSWLIENPERISEISTNARRFIEEHHHYVTSAKHYLELWKSKI
ncbi:glycosyltransferase [uncultured Winogradskyella sp.]|uniref:glycosyltransferase n=1 Tax=uncultured Winogradskyella sp. TaxID=395353 RepID=UPI00351310A8